MRKITKTQVKAAIRRTGQWTGYLAASNYAAHHIVGGWHVGCRVTITSLDELERTATNFAYYNCDAEQGRRVAYWQP